MHHRNSRCPSRGTTPPLPAPICRRTAPSFFFQETGTNGDKFLGIKSEDSAIGASDSGGEGDGGEVKLTIGGRWRTRTPTLSDTLVNHHYLPSIPNHFLSNDSIVISKLVK